MKFGWTSVAHFFASAIHDLKTAAKVTEALIPKIEAAGPEAEGITALIPVVGPTAAAWERAGEAALGQIAVILHSSDAAAADKLANVGFDKTVIDELKALFASAPTLAAQAASVKIS